MTKLFIATLIILGGLSFCLGSLLGTLVFPANALGFAIYIVTITILQLNYIKAIGDVYYGRTDKKEN